MTVRPAAGALRESIYIERRRAGTDDGFGNLTFEWEKLRKQPFRAQITPIRGLEQTISGANAGLSYWNIMVRYSTLTKDITMADRVVNARTGKAYNIVFPADFTEKNRHVRLLCTHGNAEG